MNKYLMAIDPGLLTGIVLIDITEPLEPEVVWSTEQDVEGFWQTVENVVFTYGENLEVVCESFIINSETHKKSSAPWSMKGWGVVEFLCWKAGAKFSIQSPSEKEFATNEKLQHVGFWHVGGLGHANDAFRHSVVYLVNKYRKWTKKLIV